MELGFEAGKDEESGWELHRRGANTETPLLSRPQASSSAEMTGKDAEVQKDQESCPSSSTAALPVWPGQNTQPLWALVSASVK